MKYMKLFEEFINESIVYTDLEEDLYKTFEKTGIAKRCYNGELSISASSWSLDHPNGSIGITFWLMEKIPVDKLISTAKKWAKEQGLIAGTFYKDGIMSNADRAKTQNWKNKSAMNANFVYGFTFYQNDIFFKKIYQVLN